MNMVYNRNIPPEFDFWGDFSFIKPESPDPGRQIPSMGIGSGALRSFRLCFQRRENLSPRYCKNCSGTVLLFR